MVGTVLFSTVRILTVCTVVRGGSFAVCRVCGGSFTVSTSLCGGWWVFTECLWLYCVCVCVCECAPLNRVHLNCVCVFLLTVPCGGSKLCAQWCAVGLALIGALTWSQPDRDLTGGQSTNPFQIGRYLYTLDIFLPPKCFPSFCKAIPSKLADIYIRSTFFCPRIAISCFIIPSRILYSSNPF